MNYSDTGRLLLLSAIWGASFIFMRIAAPEFGPISLILLRMLLAALVLAPFFRIIEHRRQFRAHIKDMCFIGVLNSALPFSLIAYATLSLEAGFTSLLNATTPMFAALVGAYWLHMPIRREQMMGCALALIGVGVLSWPHLSFKPGGTGWAIVASLAASLSYGCAVNYTRHRLSHITPPVIAAGSMITGTLALLPLGIWLWPTATPSPLAWLCAVLLALVCTALAYLIFFRLLVNTGAVAAVTVTFLIPVFAVIWGAWLLDEKIDQRFIIGMLLTLSGTALTVGLVKLKKSAAPPL